MALDPKTEAAIALHRFGFGPRTGAIAAIAADPRGALLAELERPGAGRITAAGLQTSGEAARVRVPRGATAPLRAPGARPLNKLRPTLRPPIRT
jgi:uncharacterized protein (DUF1800 family)